MLFLSFLLLTGVIMLFFAVVPLYAATGERRLTSRRRIGAWRGVGPRGGGGLGASRPIQQHEYTCRESLYSLVGPTCRLTTEQGEDWHTPCAANDKAALALLGLS